MNHLSDDHWLGRLLRDGLRADQRPVVGLEPGGKPAIYNHAMADWNPSPRGEIQRTQYSEFGAPPPGRSGRAGRDAADPGVSSHRRAGADPVVSQPVGQGMGGGGHFGGESDYRRAEGFRFDRRFDRPAGALDDRRAGAEPRRPLPNGKHAAGNLHGGERRFSPGKPGRSSPGNVLRRDPAHRAGVQRRTAHAAAHQASAAKFPGLVRMRASVLQQLDDEHFAARDASITTSRMGDPTFDLRAGRLSFKTRSIRWSIGSPGRPKRSPHRRAADRARGARNRI